ncbi:MAG: hypothetical protein O2894_07345 [Planctomycetota bacterium]|nr:hypothetical protein [Planctomycetota bacterium]
MARDIYEDHDEVSVAQGEMLSSGLIIVTTLVLLAACFFMQKALGEHYGEGLFAKPAGTTEAGQ